MILKRRIPIILVLNERAVVTTNFKNPYYVSDPENLIKIYSEKEVDELMVLQINERFGLSNNFVYLRKLAKLCKSPLLMGGGINSIKQIEMLIEAGVERVLLGKHAIQSPQFLKESAKKFGSSSLTVNIDYTGGIDLKTRQCKYSTGSNLLQMAIQMQDAGAGEIVFTSVDRNGTRYGYDRQLIDDISSHLNVPVILNGGCASKQSMNDILFHPDIAVAGASTAIFIREPNQAVLPVYPTNVSK